MMFFCERCCRCLGPTPQTYRRIYKNRSLCLTCRENDGEKFFPASFEAVIRKAEKDAIIVASAESRQRMFLDYDLTALEYSLIS